MITFFWPRSIYRIVALFGEAAFRHPFQKRVIPQVAITFILCTSSYVISVVLLYMRFKRFNVQFLFPRTLART